MFLSRHIILAVTAACVLHVALPHVHAETLVPPGWDPVLAGDRVMERLITVTGPQVKGAHDAEMALVGDHAYIVAEVNDVRPGESAGWPEVYAAMSIVKLNSLQVEQIVPFARSEQVFDNVTLPVGACFVPRILQKDATTLRCYFASEQPGRRQAATWYRDLDIPSRTFATTIHNAKLKTAAGVFDMEPRYFHADAVAQGFSKPAKDYGLYLFDSFKVFDGRTYVAINNWPGKQNALALVHDDFATFEVLGHYNEPQSAKLSESAVNRLPDSTWMAICRNDGGNYHFATSRDGREWTVGREMPFAPNGANSKPTFDRFGDVYYLGWQEATRIDGVRRSVFNIDVSRDGKNWQRKYRFETTKSFQYPTFHEHNGTVWLCVTQGDSSPSRKERIMFGMLEGTGNLFETSDKSSDTAPALPGTLGIPTVDISGEQERHVVINAGTEALYQGHANTQLLPDGRTVFCVWTLNHGWGEPLLKRSGDAGKTWAEVPIPANWNDSWCKYTSHPGSTLGGTSRGWLPTIHHLVGPDGKVRLFIWDRGKDNRMNQSVSEDDGKTWSSMRENGLTGCIEPPMNVIAYGDGRKHLMWFTDWTPSVHQAVSRDGGLTWEQHSSVIDTSEVPGVKMIQTTPQPRGT